VVQDANFGVLQAAICNCLLCVAKCFSEAKQSEIHLASILRCAGKLDPAGHGAVEGLWKAAVSYWDLVPNTPTPFNLNGIDRPTGRHRLRALNALAPGDRERERQALIREEGKGKRGEAGSGPDKISPYGPRRGAFAASIDRPHTHTPQSIEAV
jgi:hypothetical protein